MVKSGLAFLIGLMTMTMSMTMTMTMTFREKNGFLIFFKVVYGSTHKTDGIKWSRIFDQPPPSPLFLGGTSF